MRCQCACAASELVVSQFSVATNSYVDELDSSAQFADVEEEQPAKPAVKPIKVVRRPAQAQQTDSSDKLKEFEDQSYWGAAPPAPLEGGARRIAAEEEEEEARTLSVGDRCVAPECQSSLERDAVGMRRRDKSCSSTQHTHRGDAPANSQVGHLHTVCALW